MVFNLKNLNELYKQLDISKSIVSTITLNIDRYYYETSQPKKKFGQDQRDKKGNKRKRELLPPVDSLKEIQTKIGNKLQKIDLPQCMYGAVQGSNNTFNALEHIENKYFLTIDLKDFFKRINYKQVHKVFIDNGYSWDVARILTKLTTYKYCLPQGAPTSPTLANLAFKKTVLELLDLIKDQDITFTTFLDDLTFSSKKDFKHFQDPILEIIKANKFFPSPKKIHYRENSCDVTGLFVGNGKLRIHPDMRKAAMTNRNVRNYIRYVEECYQEYLLDKTL